ncbi:hypothetical protein PIB30_063653 [Stylosanthes scabra]|uniref:Uncharacterized protein n=1 Tax=Stylosanthes scabra TaxID=79078 RepID=A0ABU6XK39_9FABA|nr:hypothetical protein [Stylosanthes scabra]
MARLVCLAGNLHWFLGKCGCKHSSANRSSGTYATQGPNAVPLRWDRQTVQFSVNAWPHSPDNRALPRECKNVKIDSIYWILH